MYVPVSKWNSVVLNFEKHTNTYIRWVRHYSNFHSYLLVFFSWYLTPEGRKRVAKLPVRKQKHCLFALSCILFTSLGHAYVDIMQIAYRFWGQPSKKSTWRRGGRKNRECRDGTVLIDKWISEWIQLGFLYFCPESEKSRREGRVGKNHEIEGAESLDHDKGESGGRLIPGDILRA